MACGFAALIAAMSRPSWKPGRRHGTHTTRSPKHSCGQLLPVRRRRQRDPGVGVQVVHVRGVDQPVHRGVDRRRGAALAVQAVVERGDHLVLALHARVDVDQAAAAGPAAAPPGSVSVSVPRSPPGALDPHQLHRLPGDRVGRAALRGGVPAGVVGVARVGAEPVRAGDQIRRRSWFSVMATSRWWLMGSRANTRKIRAGQEPQPAWVPPTRSAAIRCGVAGRGVGGDRVARQAAAPPARSASSAADVGVVGVHQHGVRAEHVTGPLRRRPARRGRPAAPWRAACCDVEHRADLAGDLLLDVVALVEHEVDSRRRQVRRRSRRSRSGSGTAGTGPRSRP